MINLSSSVPRIKKQQASKLLDASQRYRDRGWPVFPVAGKKPLGPWKAFQQEPPDQNALLRLFAKENVTGIAVVTGRVSGGLAIRDFDDGNAYQAWARTHPYDAERLPTVKTARGFHLYGRLDEEAFVDFGNGELRGDSGHYTLLPPSIHPSGQPYQWINPLPDGDLPLLPASLTTQATQQPKQLTACFPSAAADAILATLPTAPGQRNRRVFELARRLKGMTGLNTSPEMLKAIVTEWHRRAMPVIRTKELAETWSDFQTAWLNVKCPWGTKVRAAYFAARQAPSIPLDDNTELGVLAAMCRILGENTLDRTFFLSCRTVEELFGVGRMTAWRWLQSLRFYGVIEPVKIGTKKDRRATVWKYLSHGTMRRPCE
jgi:hypothetical protein